MKCTMQEIQKMSVDCKLIILNIIKYSLKYKISDRQMKLSSFSSDET